MRFRANRGKHPSADTLAPITLPPPHPPPQRKISPLYIAAKHGHSEVVRLLLEKGAKKDAANNVGAVVDGCLN
jgi:ankyrin repeat protein